MSILLRNGQIWVNLTELCQSLFCVLQLCLVSIVGFILYCIDYLPDERSSMQFIIKVSLHTPGHDVCRSYLWLTQIRLSNKPITQITIPSVLRELQQKELCRDSYAWISAFINVTLSFSLINHTIYAVGISRQLKLVHHCLVLRSRSLKAALIFLLGSCVHTWFQICTVAFKRVFQNT